MPSSIDVARYILDKFGDMTTMKLQKLVYYCQAYCLAWYDRPMFDEKVHAWTHGPVVYELFNEHRGLYRISANDLETGDSRKLGEDERDVIDSVCDAFRGLTGWELRNRTHEEAPWIDNFHEEAAWHNEEIPQEQMKQFYAD